MLKVFFLNITFFVLVLPTNGQTKVKVDSISFCGKKIKIPEGCEFRDGCYVNCDTYSLLWFDMDKTFLEIQPDLYVNDLELQSEASDNFRKSEIKCFLLDQEVRAFKVSFKANRGPDRQIIAAGIVNGAPVFVKVALSNEINKNSDLPEFIRSILKLTK